ncbi:MAG: hypothetical protein WC919_05625 [Candidatus Paceibacterota bacterium]|jgi:hypothetical protein
MLKLAPNFLHSHEHLLANPGHEHVMVDKADWEEAHRIIRILTGTDRPGDIKPLNTYDFNVFLKDDTEFDEKTANALLESGCDDGTFAKNDCICHIRFSREAGSLDEAIRTAVADIRKAGCDVVRVELDTEATSLFVTLS